MTGEEKTTSKKGLIAYIATKRTWLIPIIRLIHSYGGLTLEELKELTGLRTQVLKRALWWLKKYGVVDVSGAKYIIEPEYRDVLNEVFIDYCVSGNKHLFRLGRTYFVVSVKHRRITSYTVPVDYVEKLIEMESNIQTEFKPPDLSQALGIPLKLARKIIVAKKLLDECWRK